MVVRFAAIDDCRAVVVGHLLSAKGLQHVLRFDRSCIVFGDNAAVIDSKATVRPGADLIGGGLGDLARLNQKVEHRSRNSSSSSCESTGACNKIGHSDETSHRPSRIFI